MKQLPSQKTQELMMLHQQGNIKAAGEMAKKLIKDYPKELLLHNILGVYEETEGNLNAAAKSYQNALNINQNIPELQFNLGAILDALDDNDGAIEHYQKAIKLNPSFTEAFFNLGITYQRQSNYDLAIKSYEKAISFQPGFYEAIGNIGTIKQLQGNLEEAITFFKKSLTIFEHGRGHYNIAGAYRNLGNLSLSIKHYKKAIEISSGEPEFYSDLGDALWHDGKIEEADRFLRMAVDIDSSHQKSNYQLGVYLYDNKAFIEAIKYFESAQIGDSEERILYCLYKLKEFDQFKEKLAGLITKKNCSPFLATLSAHYAQNFKIEDLYNFCPSPLDFVCHEQIPELVKNNQQLIKDLINDIDNADIGQRKQSRLTAGIQSSGNLFKREEISFNKLAEALKKIIKKYFLKYKNEDNEFIKSFPKNILFSSAWYVRMQSGGHLTSHIHEEGWISGAVYLVVPKDSGPDKQEGAIELSSDGDEYPRLHNEFEKKVILPNEGDVIFFPSSVFHRTIPFNSKEERICIAFDVKPKFR
ncbi:MAG: hypothetical protein CMH24_00195 [Nitrosomonadales bacterium]|nr:hypothetical protein [Nitrosomonadales bacterium]|tara:strand:- start:1805 stop:3391 length:1587 start_codon:yes stop_codon:yes gene_type:complete